MTAPGTVGNYTMTLTYHYTDHLGQPKTAPVSLPFSVTDFAPVPALGIYKTATHTQPVFPIGNPPTFGLHHGNDVLPLSTTRRFREACSIPGASFYKSSDANQSIGGGDTSIGTTTNDGPADVRLGARVLHELLHQGRRPGDRARLQVHGDSRQAAAAVAAAVAAAEAAAGHRL